MNKRLGNPGSKIPKAQSKPLRTSSTLVLRTSARITKSSSPYLLCTFYTPSTSVSVGNQSSTRVTVSLFTGYNVK